MKGLEVKILARTFEIDKVAKQTGFSAEDLEVSTVDDFNVFGGKMAGICYMADSYFEEGIQNEEKALKRATSTAERGHHSVFEHSKITFQFNGIPKIMAMLLNSVNVYNTSEKSARYTLMKPETEKEQELYVKWTKKISEAIKEEYPDMTDKEINKLAIENARYMLSVFTPTCMAWSIDYRNLCYLFDHLGDLKDRLDKMDGEFNKRLGRVVGDFLDKTSCLFDNRLVFDNKDEYIRFLPVQAGFDEEIAKESYGDTYSAKYQASLSILAHLHRHRTLRVRAIFHGDQPNEFGFYVPEIVKEHGMKKEWLKDMFSIKDVYPQGILVEVIEQGLFEDFVNKCKDRMCGRAQLEIMMLTEKTLWKFIDNKDNLSEHNKKLLAKIAKNNIPCAKCTYTKCNEKCRWGADEALTRLV